MIKLAGNPLQWMFSWVRTLFLERVLLRRSYERIYGVLGGHIFFQTLRSAIELDLFSLVQRHGRMTQEQIAQELKCAEQPIRILLLGCASLKLLRKRGNFYSNTLLSRQLFVRGAPRNIIDVVRWQHHINYRAMFHFAEAIRGNTNLGLEEFTGNEKTLYERLAHNEPLEKIFQLAMESISAQANAILADCLDLRGAKYLVDVGGGNGTNMVAFAKKFPSLRGAVFDSASVCAIAREYIAREGLSARLDTWPGDCFRDPFPEQVDAILFAHFFTIWSEASNRQLLRKCFESLPSGGAVIIFNMMQKDSRDGPLAAAMGSPYFLTLATGEGMLYTWSEYANWMREAGFQSVATRRLPRDHGVIIGTKA